MFGAFTCTASSTISQMEKMLTVFSPLYELSIFRLVAISNFVELPVRTSLKQHEGSRAAAGFLDLIDYLFASASCGPIFPPLAEVRRLADALGQDCDRLDVLINNAGIGSGGAGGSERPARTAMNCASPSITSPVSCSPDFCCLSC